MKTDQECLSQLLERRKQFEYLVQDTDFSRLAIAAGWNGILTCPCCGYPTLLVANSYDICPICNWEDDGQEEPGADQVFGGANGDYSLNEARLNFCRGFTMYRLSDSTRFFKTTRSALRRKVLCSALALLLESRDYSRILESIVEADRHLRDLKVAD
ncbi:MAG: hypothetical protein M3N19_05115 [Candidatus Eremiobacteraeota bacterium]|nr:hypothetical protein [Candidatus Eremiobacteraeota bacterium]